MLNILLKFKFWLESKTESKPKERRTLISKIILNGFKLIATYFIYAYLLLKKNLGLIKVNQLVDDGNSPIVSLTTFPARINNLWMVLYCLFRQTVRPAKIIVILTEEEMPQGAKALPSSLDYFMDKGVEFHFVRENLFPHNKYFYARQWFSERIIITVDDDLLYYPDTIERLMKLHEIYPDAVCSNRIQKIKFDDSGIYPHGEWELVFKQQSPSHSFLGLGYSAVLYPPKFVYKDLYNTKLIKELCLKADDLWLKAMELHANVKVVNGSYYAHPVTLPTSQKVSLQSVNRDKIHSRNDLYWKKMDKYYDLLNLIQRRTNCIK